MSEHRSENERTEREPTLCSCPPGPCLGWAFDAALCRVVASHAEPTEIPDVAYEHIPRDCDPGMLGAS